MEILDKIFGGERSFRGKELEIIEELTEIIERQEKEIERLTKLLYPGKLTSVKFDVVFN